MIESLRLIVSLYSLKCQCFTGETLVSTTEGDKRIDEIEVGDYVYAYDTETGENVASKVTYVSITETDILVHVYTSEGEEIKATMLHPFYVKNAKNGDEEYGIWKASANLVAGDELLTEDGRAVYVEEIKLERLEENIKVYNLEVEGLHTYYVGSGILVHNAYPSGDSGSESGSTSDELIHVYRGTYKYAEIVAYNETGQLMSDATRNLYFETGNLDAAYAQSSAIHDNWLNIWGNQNDYVQAHGAFGTELSQAFGLDRTFMSVTTEPDVARRFAGVNGQVFEAYIPKSQLIEQTLGGAGESEYLIKFGAGGFK